MHIINPRDKETLPDNADKGQTDQQQSDPPLTEIKGITDPEEYEEPEVEDNPE